LQGQPQINPIKYRDLCFGERCHNFFFSLLLAAYCLCTVHLLHPQQKNKLIKKKRAKKLNPFFTESAMSGEKNKSQIVYRIHL
jgi:hypothetical protein